MARPSIGSGAVIDGFTIGECVHRGGMATLWSVTHPEIAVPLLMKIPRVSEGEDPAAHRQFRDGADDPASAVWRACAGLFRRRRFFNTAADMPKSTQITPHRHVLQCAKPPAFCLAKSVSYPTCRC